MKTLTQEQHRQQFIAQGGNVQDMPDGPRLEQFDALTLSLALEQECNRAEERGLGKVRIDLDLIDALALARFMRRANLLGA